MIIIPYKLDNGEQLRYTLRSIAKFYDDMVVLVGDKPDWYDGAYIERDKGSFPAQLDSELNIVKGLTLAKEYGIKKAVLWHDDMIVFRRIDLEDRHEATLEEMIERKPQLERWFVKTKRVLDYYKLPGLAYTLHRPYEVDVERYLSISNNISLPRLKGAQPVLPRCIYSNSVNTIRRPSRKDYKIYTESEPLKSCEVVSTLVPSGLAWERIKTRFTKRSRYERK